MMRGRLGSKARNLGLGCGEGGGGGWGTTPHAAAIWDKSLAEWQSGASARAVAHRSKTHSAAQTSPPRPAASHKMVKCSRIIYLF